MLRLCVTSVHIISVHKGKHPAPACEECFLEGFRCKRLRVWGYILIGVCFTATVTFSGFVFFLKQRDVLWLMRLSSGSKPCTLLKCPWVKYWIANSSCAANFDLWPPRSVEEGDVESLCGGHSLLVRLREKQKQPSTLVRLSFIYVLVYIPRVLFGADVCKARRDTSEAKTLRWKHRQQLQQQQHRHEAHIFGSSVTSHNWQGRRWLCLSHKDVPEQDFNQRPTSSYVLHFCESK